jgi:hypothetical protein
LWRLGAQALYCAAEDGSGLLAESLSRISPCSRPIESPCLANKSSNMRISYYRCDDHAGKRIGLSPVLVPVMAQHSGNLELACIAAAPLCQLASVHVCPDW